MSTATPRFGTVEQSGTKNDHKTQPSRVRGLSYGISVPDCSTVPTAGDTAARELLSRCADLEISLRVEDEWLEWDAPDGVVGPALLAELKAMKPRLIQALTGPTLAKPELPLVDANARGQSGTMVPEPSTSEQAAPPALGPGLSPELKARRWGPSLTHDLPGIEIDRPRRQEAPAQRGRSLEDLGLVQIRPGVWELPAVADIDFGPPPPHGGPA